MKQQVWSSPKTTFEEFVPQVYCANCSGDDYHGTIYYFECNAGELGLKSYPYAVYEGTYSGNAKKNFFGNWTGHGGKYRNMYHACGEKHEASSEDEFISGFMDDERTDDVFEAIPVIIWTEGGTDTHCTTNLNKEDWEIAKS